MVERTYLTMAALGSDEPGLVRLVSRYVAARGGNVEDSRMVALGGVFGVMLLLSATPDDAMRITADAKTLAEESGLRVMIEAARDPRPKGALWNITASAADRPGMLADLAEVVRAAGGSIVELDTTTSRGVGGSPASFDLRMTVALQAPGEMGRMKDALMAIALEERIERDSSRAARPDDGAGSDATALGSSPSP